MSAPTRPSFAPLTPLCLLACGGDPATTTAEAPDGTPLAPCGVEVAP